MASPAPADTQSSSSDTFILHVLCPSIPPPNRFTFHDLTPATTIANLKSRISQSVPTRPLPESQRLIYRGKPLANDGASLQGVIEPTNGSEYSMHLVLPPAPVPHATTTGRSPSSAPSRESTGLPSLQPHSHPASRFAPPTYTPNDQGMRYRGPAVPVPQNEEAIGLALRRNIENIRRQVDMEERRLSPHPDRHDNTTTPSAWRQLPHSPQTPTSPSHFTMPPNVAQFSSRLPEESRLRLHIIRPQIALCEDQLNRGSAPPIEHIIRLRSQLLGILDDQYRNPLSERDSSVETLLTRVFNIYTRADQLRVMQSRSPPTLQPSSANLSGISEPSETPRYLLSSPDGYRGIVTPQAGVESLQMSVDAIRAAHASQVAAAFSQANGNPAEEHHNQNNAAVMENVVRQAVLQQRVGGANGQMGIARSIRRLWLFVRLYFFCYMFSEPGTWTRMFFVSLAVLISLLSETGVPQQIYRMTVAPVQRHLEGLVHFSPDEHLQQPQADAAGRPNHRPAEAGAGGLRHSLRRVERSVALFLASLVPGVGERHIEVRNAAEAARNAERTREEERRREAEAANEANAQPEQNAQEGNPGSEQTTANGNGPHETIPRETRMERGRTN